jgi:MFS transporter, DHA2 family, multidrug resistance protein
MAEPSPDPAVPPQVNRWVVAISVMAGTFMVVLDTTVVNVSLPHIAGSLSATTEEATWALTSYLAANAVILPITGWLANTLGRKRLLLGSLVGFTSASFMCGLSPTLSVLIVWRVIQGLTGGVMQPLSQAVLLEAFPPHERGKAMGFWGLGIVVAPILGPVLGGWLTDNWSWRWVFYINIPVGVAAVTMTWLFIFDPPYIRRALKHIDVLGIGLMTVGVGALQVGLDRGQESDWFSSRFITTLLITAAVALSLLIARELTARNPVIDLRIFRERTYSTGVLLITLVGVVLYANLVLLPIMLQNLMGYSPYAAGVAMAPRGMGSFLAMPIVGMLVGRMDARKLLVGGILMGALSQFWLASLNLNAGYWDLFWPQFVQGISLGLLFVPLTTITMDRISKPDMGNATSQFNLMRNIGGSVGIALIQTFVVRQRQLHTNRLGEHISAYSPGARIMFERLESAFRAAGADPVTAAHKATAALWGMVQREAATLAFLDAFHVLGILFLAIVPLVLLMRRPKAAPGGPVAAGE